MSKTKTQWMCDDCGYTTLKYAGKCFSCNSFGTMREFKEPKAIKNSGEKSSFTINSEYEKPSRLEDVEKNYLSEGISSGFSEFDRICGGSITKGSVTLLGGDPGTGKSTLLTKIAHNISENNTVLYVSGEESKHQIKKRSVERMKLEMNENFLVSYSNSMESIEEFVEEFKPTYLVIDSVNTIGSAELPGDPGDIGQMRHIAKRIVNLAKSTGTTIACIVQVTKDKSIAGPKNLEHMVDTVFYLEGEKFNDLRLLRSNKNRFADDQSVACFQMTEFGMEEIKNPSGYLLENRLPQSPGNCVVAITETRPLLIEVQALVVPLQYENATPRRTTVGFDRNRLSVIIAVLEKRCGMRGISFKDVFVNVVGGMKIEEPGTDLGVALSIYSAQEDLAIEDDIVVVGEVGLSGEVRPVTKIEQLAKEATRVGFKRIILPNGSYNSVKDLNLPLELIPVKTVKESIDILFRNKKTQ